MNNHFICSIFKNFRSATLSMRKVPNANSHLHITKGTRMVSKARKYRRPKDLEDPYYYGIGPKEEVKTALKSLSKRGFGKEQVSYTPPENVDSKIKNICSKVFGGKLSNEWKNQSLDDPLLKFKVLTKCIETFGHDVPNSQLHKITDVEALSKYYTTPVDGSLHFDTLVRESHRLPPNLHLMADTPAFVPGVDTFFDGWTAYPGRKRIIHTKTGQKFEKIIQWPNM